MPDPSHLLIARVHGVAARSAELRLAAQELADASAEQDGCLGFDVLTVAADASELRAHERVAQRPRAARPLHARAPTGATSPR